MNHNSTELDLASVFDEENIQKWDNRELGADKRYARSVPMSPRLMELLQKMKVQHQQSPSE
jgi:hypothetical protein